MTKIVFEMVTTKSRFFFLCFFLFFPLFLMLISNAQLCIFSQLSCQEDIFGES